MYEREDTCARTYSLDATSRPPSLEVAQKAEGCAAALTVYAARSSSLRVKSKKKRANSQSQQRKALTHSLVSSKVWMPNVS
jgi:hypothetical protein